MFVKSIIVNRLLDLIIHMLLELKDENTIEKIQRFIPASAIRFKRLFK
jgi:hypothetical protein